METGIILIKIKMNQVNSLNDATSDEEYAIPMYESKRGSSHEDIYLVSLEISSRNDCPASQNNAYVSNSLVKQDLSTENRESDKASREITNGFISLDVNSRISCKNIDMNVGVKSEHGSEYTNAVAGPSGICRVEKTDKEIFACGLCRKTFTKCWVFDIHFQTHVDKKPFPWEVCENKFAENADLDKHYGMHIGEEPFVCEVCQKEFTQKKKIGNAFQNSH